MKKYWLIAVAVLVAAIVGATGVYFLKSEKRVSTPATQEVTQPVASKQFSFRGVLADVVGTVKEGVANITGSSETAPPPPSPFVENSTDTSSDSFSFAVFGDTKEFGINDPNGNLEKAVARTKDVDLKAVFVMGDLIKSCGDGCENKFNDWKSVMTPLLSKTYEVVGNHDRTGGDSDDAVWQKVFNLPQNGPAGYKELVYSFDIGNSHFAVLDSEKPKGNIINSVQRDWLDQDLNASTKEHKLVFYHEPAFQAAQDAEDGLDAQPKERDAFWNIIKKNHVDAVFNGHAHIYARKKIDGIEQIVVGDTDSTNDDIVQPGLSDFGYKGKSYAIVTVNGKNINLKLFTVDGKQVDSFDFI